jgi:hypothetical protein
MDVSQERLATGIPLDHKLYPGASSAASARSGALMRLSLPGTNYLIDY